MKTRLLAIVSLLLFVSVTVFADDKEGPKLEFEKERHDYGTVYVDSMPETKLDITFTNTGDEPLVLSNVRGCCGTRIREWPKEPIMPDEEGVIKIEFRLAPRPQRISRTITVHYNNEDNPTERYRIVGKVVEREQ
ncbi:MAG: DUF1573 domain-containing protein [Bacteroidales bacterium]